MKELTEDIKNILGLKLPTDPRWVNLTEKSLEEILTDHAFCEQKAATQCISLIQRYADKEDLVNALAPIVTEEWGHFRLVLSELTKRGLPLGRQRKDIYVNKLIEFQKKGGSPDERFLDQMLTMALIEARSCERFRLLSDQISDKELADFYRELMISEASHYSTFISLARKYGNDIEDVNARWQAWLEFEARVIQNYGKAQSIHG